MRIDEFSSSEDIDGSFSTSEKTRFMTFGFDIALSTLDILFSELYILKSYITLKIELISDILLTRVLKSTIIEGE